MASDLLPTALPPDTPEPKEGGQGAWEFCAVGSWSLGSASVWIQPMGVFQVTAGPPRAWCPFPMPTHLPGPVTATCPSPAAAPLLRAMGYKCCPLLTQPYLCLVCDPLVSLPSLTLQSELPASC